jgi:hypothetical protein
MRSDTRISDLQLMHSLRRGPGRIRGALQAFFEPKGV